MTHHASRSPPHRPAQEPRWPPWTHEGHPRADRAHGNPELRLGLPAHPWRIEEGRTPRSKDNETLFAKQFCCNLGEIDSRDAVTWHEA